MLKGSSEALKAARKRLVPLCESWNYQDWDEVKWDRIKDLSFRDLLNKRQELAETAQDRDCLKCPKFIDHVRFSGMRGRVTDTKAA